MEPNTELTSVADDGQGQSDASNSGDSDLNSLLAEYEAGTTAEPKPAPVTPERTIVQPDLSKLNPVIDYVQNQMKKDQQTTFDTDVDAAVDRMAEQEALKGIPKAIVGDAVIAHAFKDKGFDKAFQNRADDPTAWVAAQNNAVDVLVEKFKDLPRAEAEPDPGISRDDIEAAKATVAGVSETSEVDEGPSVEDRTAMNGAQWQRYLEKRVAAAS